MYVLQNLGAMFVAIGDLKSLKMHCIQEKTRFDFIKEVNLNIY